jgi:hypothetical protein
MSWLPQTPVFPGQITPFLSSPRTIALIYAGATAYIGFIDQSSRNALPNVRDRLTQWVESFKPSLRYFGGLALLGSALAVGAYFKTKVKLWLVGGALMFALWPYTMLVLMPTNKSLLKIDA